MDPDVSWGNGSGCLQVVHYRVDLQLVHGFRCCDNTARMRNVSECLFLFYAWFIIAITSSLLSSSLAAVVVVVAVAVVAVVATTTIITSGQRILMRDRIAGKIFQGTI